LDFFLTKSGTVFSFVDEKLIVNKKANIIDSKLFLSAESAEK